MKTVLITGANSGLRKATAIALAQQSYRVIMVCRNRERGELALREVVKESGNQNVELMLCDISSLQSIRDFCRLYKEFNILKHLKLYL